MSGHRLHSTTSKTFSNLILRFLGGEAGSSAPFPLHPVPPLAGPALLRGLRGSAEPPDRRPLPVGHQLHPVQRHGQRLQQPPAHPQVPAAPPPGEPVPLRPAHEGHGGDTGVLRLLDHGPHQCKRWECSCSMGFLVFFLGGVLVMGGAQRKGLFVVKSSFSSGAFHPWKS